MEHRPLLTDAEIRTTQSHPANMKFDKLREFRQAAYKLLGKAHDATFELADAILTTRNAYSLANLSLSPFFRRKWPSIYEALQDSRPNCKVAIANQRSTSTNWVYRVNIKWARIAHPLPNP